MILRVVSALCIPWVPVVSATPNSTSKTTGKPTGHRLAKDGKWQLFPKIPHLLQHVSNGSFYGRTKVDGKIIRHPSFAIQRVKLAATFEGQCSVELFRTGNPQRFQPAAKTQEQPIFTGSERGLVIFELSYAAAAFRPSKRRQV